MIRKLVVVMALVLTLSACPWGHKHTHDCPHQPVCIENCEEPVDVISPDMLILSLLGVAGVMALYRRNKKK